MKRENDRMNKAVDILMELGDPGGRAEWRDYLSLLGPHAEDDLIEVIRDPAFVWAETHSNESWAALHAWRALGQLRSLRAIPALVALLDECEDDDWMIQDLPMVFGMVGIAALPALSQHLADGAKGWIARSTASTALVRIARSHPEVRDECMRAQMSYAELVGGVR